MSEREDENKWGKWPPRSVRIGPYDYAIEWWDATDESESGRFGEIVYDKQIIRVSVQRKRQQVAATFKHEVTHALWFMYGARKKKVIEAEDIAGAMEYGWCQFVRDNRDAVEWMNDLLWNEPERMFGEVFR